MNYSAVIFDLDGTVLLNEEVYAKAFLTVLKEHGVCADTPGVEAQKPHIPGIGMEKNWEIMKRKFALSEEFSVGQLSHETQDEYHKRLSEVVVRPGFYGLQEVLAEEGVLTALATSNDWWFVEDELEDLGLQKYFNVTVTVEEVENPKPEPDIFWKAAEKLGVEARACVVIEDSKAGVKGAKEAGMKVVVVLNENTDREDFPDADLVVEDFTELSPQLLDSFF